MKQILTTLLLSLYTLGEAQDYYHSNYQWEKEPKNYAASDKEKKADLVIVFQKRIFEIAYDPDGKAVMYETSHIKYHLNNATAVDRVNKGFVPMGNVIEDLNLQARTITPENKIINFNTSTIKKVDDYEDSGPYKIFAIDGVESGCDVEILYTNKRYFSYGSYYYSQSGSPIAHFEARIISPENLIYEAKSYNGLPAFQKDTTNKEKNHLYVMDENVPAAEDERYASEGPNYRGYAYQLYYNTAKNRARLYTWDIISREYYADLYTFTKDELKAVSKYLSKNKLNKAETDEEKIKNLDVHFKTGFEINDNYQATLGNALASHKMSYSNGMRFYIAALKELGISFEVGITTRRDEMRFDSKFPSYIYTKVYLLYFPGIDKYLSPLSIYSRLGYPDPDIQDNEGVFIKEVEVSGMNSSTMKIKLIPTKDYQNNYHLTDVKTTLDFEKQTVNLDVAQSLAGYAGYYTQPVYRYYNAEQREQQNKTAYILPEMEPKDLVVENTDEEDLFVVPMVTRYKAEQNDLLEVAGTKYVLKAGMLIGPQVELYSEHQRMWPADVYNAHYLKRRIEINIPAGYKVTNLEELSYEKKCELDGKILAQFKSSAKQEGDKIILEVYEDYRVVEYKLPVYEQFRAVINASADFNKKNLIFEKQ